MDAGAQSFPGATQPEYRVTCRDKSTDYGTKYIPSTSISGPSGSKTTYTEYDNSSAVCVNAVAELRPMSFGLKI